MNGEQTPNEIYHRKSVRLQTRDSKPIIGISVGIGIAALLFALCACILYVLLRRRWSPRNESARTSVEELPNIQPTRVPTPPPHSAGLYTPPPRYPDSGLIATRQMTSMSPQSDALRVVALAVRQDPPSSFRPATVTYPQRPALTYSQQTSPSYSQSQALTSTRPTQAVTAPRQETQVQLRPGETYYRESNTTNFNGGSTQSDVYEATARRDSSWAEFTHERTETGSGSRTVQRLRYSGPSGFGVITSQT
jgi:hypothetical protein